LIFQQSGLGEDEPEDQANEEEKGKEIQGKFVSFFHLTKGNPVSPASVAYGYRDIQNLPYPAVCAANERDRHLLSG
jgi:hypothetical protein